MASSSDASSDMVVCVRHAVVISLNNINIRHVLQADSQNDVIRFFESIF
jgi:hypothetical protein